MDKNTNMYLDNKQNFYFHDYETFGTNPASDRPAQFAGVRTDSEFSIISDPLVIYCQPANDYLPDPLAVLITGITPQIAQQRGVIEAEFARQIHAAFSEPKTCIVGYNNIRFDDEISRYLFYRNFYDPYSYSWQNGNSRWDLLDMVRACYALRPEGIEWPKNDKGLPSFKLEHLTKANGLTHSHAHDAMSDVYATIAVAQLIKKAQPKLFSYLFSLRNKHNVTALIDMVNLTPLVHISGMLGAYRGNTSWIVPLAWHPTNTNAVIICDLAGNVDALIDLSSQEIIEKLYTKSSDLLSDEQRIPLKLIHINKCPVIAPAKTLHKENAQRLGIDREHCLTNLHKIKQHHQKIREKVTAIFNDNYSITAKDVDLQLYQGFFDTHDKKLISLIPHTPPEQLAQLHLPFNDKRLSELLFRYRAKNYPQTLDEQSTIRWLDHRQNKLNTTTVEAYLFDLTQLIEKCSDDKDKTNLLKHIYYYCQSLLC